jgi:hypothetical protein
MKEAKFTARFAKSLAKLGGSLVTIHGNMYVVNMPDRYLCHRTWRGLVEFKREGGRLGDGQRATIEKLWRQAPGSVFVVWPTRVECPWGDGWLEAPWDGDVRTLLEYFKRCEEAWP